MARAQKSAFSRKKKEIPVFEKVAAPYFFSAKHDAILLYRNACFPEKCHFFSCCIVSSTAAHFCCRAVSGEWWGGWMPSTPQPNPTPSPVGEYWSEWGGWVLLFFFLFWRKLSPYGWLVAWLHVAAGINGEGRKEGNAMQLLMRKIWDTAEHAFFVDSIRTSHNITSKETFLMLKATILSHFFYDSFSSPGLIPMGLCTDRMETGGNATARSRRCSSYFPFFSQTVFFFFFFRGGKQSTYYLLFSIRIGWWGKSRKLREYCGPDV